MIPISLHLKVVFQNKQKNLTQNSKIALLTFFYAISFSLLIMFLSMEFHDWHQSIQNSWRNFKRVLRQKSWLIQISKTINMASASVVS